MAEPFDDDPLVRSLRAPGTPSELSDQERYVAMFRESRGGGSVTPLAPGSPRRPGGRAARRLGVGTTLSITLAVAGGGVAAAYNGSLPEPLQNFAHTVLGPVNVPPPAQRDPDRVSTAPTPTPSPSAQESPTDSEPSTTVEPAKPAGDGPEPTGQAEPGDDSSDEPSDGPSDVGSADPSAAASSSPTPTPTVSPTPTPTPTSSPVVEPLRPDTVSISGSTRRVEYAESPTFSGVVRTEDGSGVGGVKVALMQRQDGAWRRVGSATTDETGGVHLTAPPIHGTTALRFKTKGARSDRWRVAMHPTLALSTSVSGNTVTIVASAVGGRPGDVVRLGRRRDGQKVILATGLLGPDGTVTFQVRQPTDKARYGALLEASDAHTSDREAVVVVKPKTPRGEGEDDPEESPSPSPSG